MNLYDKILNIFAPKPVHKDYKSKYTKEGFEVIVATNEVGEEVILEIPKDYKGIIRV